MSDHPVLIPTPGGPVGGIVSEPEGVPRAALVLFQSGGPAARCGVNAAWTRIAHELCDLGITVLRFDLACEADSTPVGIGAPRQAAWRSELDLPLTRRVSAWFCERTGTEILYAGVCYGARLALEIAAEDARVGGVFIATPYLSGIRRRAKKPAEPSARESALAELPNPPADQNDTLAAVPAESARTIAARGTPLWILIGERDAPHALQLRQRLDAAGEPAPEVEVSPGIALHPGTDPLAQNVIAEGLVRRVAQELEERSHAGATNGQRAGC